MLQQKYFQTRIDPSKLQISTKCYGGRILVFHSILQNFQKPILLKFSKLKDPVTNVERLSSTDATFGVIWHAILEVKTKPTRIKQQRNSVWLTNIVCLFENALRWSDITQRIAKIIAQLRISMWPRRRRRCRRFASFTIENFVLSHRWRHGRYRTGNRIVR